MTKSRLKNILQQNKEERLRCVIKTDERNASPYHRIDQKNDESPLNQENDKILYYR
jgi:hypothetical protein